MNHKQKIHNDDVKIGLRMKVARREIGLSRVQVAQALNITQQQVDKYERGGNRISARTLFILSSLFDKPMTWFTEDLKEENRAGFMQETSKNLLAIRTIKELHKIEDKSIQDKIIRIIRILVEKV